MRVALHRLQLPAILFLLIVSILWRGGKSIDATWALACVAGTITLLWYYEFRAEKRQAEFTAQKSTWIALLTFIGLTILSFLFSSTQNYGLDEVFHTVSLGLIFLWITRLRYPEKFTAHVVRVIVITTLIACVIGIAVYTLQPVNRFVGTFFDARFHTDYWPNAWAQYLLLAWPLVLILPLGRFTKYGSIIRTITIGIIVGCFVLSYSRGALIAFAGQIALLGLLHLSITGKKKFISKTMMIGIAGTLITAVALFYGVNEIRSARFAVQDVGEKITFTADEGSSSIDERAQFWQQATALAFQKPLFGWGPYSFRFVQPRLQTDVLATSDHPHTIFLKYAMERGIPAMIAFIVLLGLITVGAFSSFAHAQSSERMMRGIFLIAIAGVIAHNLIDFNLQFVGIALPFWIMLGLVTPRITVMHAEYPKVYRYTEIMLAVALLILALMEGRHLIYSSLGRHSEGSGQTVDAIRYYEKARKEIFSRDLHLSRAVLLNSMNRPETAREEIALYLSSNEEDFRAWKLLGDIAPDDEQAIYYYTASMDHGAGYNDLSVAHALTVKQLRADRNEFTNTWKPQIDQLLIEYADAVERNTHFIALSQNVEAFIELANLLAATYPSEDYRYELLAARVSRASEKERGVWSARPPGNLW